MIQTGNGGMSPADMAAVLGNNGYGNGNGWGFGGDGAWWLLVLFLFAFAGNAGWGGFGGNGGGAIPYMMNNTTQSDVQRGFDQQAVIGAIGNVGNAVNNGFASADVARCNQTTTILQTLANNQITSIQGMNSLAMALQQCCCDNRASVADVKYAIAQENCADRQAVNDGVRDLMAQNTGNTNSLITTMNNGFQSLRDEFCNLRLEDTKRDYENQLRAIQSQLTFTQNELAAARSAASQNAQTFDIVSRLNPTPSPAYIVQNPRGCACANYQNVGCCG
jgi:hypothetical protein